MSCPLTYVRNAFTNLPQLAGETRLAATRRRHRAMTALLEAPGLYEVDHEQMQHARAALLRFEDALAAPIENNAAQAGQPAGLKSHVAAGVEVQPRHSRWDRISWLVIVDGEVVAIEEGATAATISASSRARKLNRS